MNSLFRPTNAADVTETDSLIGMEVLGFLKVNGKKVLRKLSPTAFSNALASTQIDREATRLDSEQTARDRAAVAKLARESVASIDAASEKALAAFAQVAQEVAGDQRAAANSALVAAAATQQDYTASIYDIAGVKTGTWYVDRMTSVQSRHSRLYSEIVKGDGEVDFYLEVNGIRIHGPWTVNAGSPYDARDLNLLIPIDAKVSFALTRVQGSVTEVYATTRGKVA